MENLLVRTRFLPPRLRRDYLPRERVSQRLATASDYPLILVQAEGGYGKSTALAAFLVGQSSPSAWYGLTEADADPLCFLLHLIHALRNAAPNLGEASLSCLTVESTTTRQWQRVLNTLLNESLEHFSTDTFFVLDDFHLVEPQAEIRSLVEGLIAQLPPRLHLILSTRQQPKLRGLARRQAKGDVLTITEADLAFTESEIAALFAARYGLNLTPGQTATLATETEGWAIALQMVWQRLQGLNEAGERCSLTDNSLDQVLDNLPESLTRSDSNLFNYLSEEVLAGQPEPIRNFLYQTAPLRHLDPPACNALTGRTDSALILRQLDETGLFTFPQGDGSYRYHHLFHEFLIRQGKADPVVWAEQHRRAASYFDNSGNSEAAFYHWQKAGEYTIAAQRLVGLTDALLRSGRLDTLAGWIDLLPPEIVEETPRLLLSRGEICRLKSRYDEALTWYRRADAGFADQGDPLGRSLALRGQASVYLDTVNPAPAEGLLKQALKVLGNRYPAETSRVLQLIAENKMNQGQTALAEKLLRAADRLSHRSGVTSSNQPGSKELRLSETSLPQDDKLDARLYLRTGRLDTARAFLEQQLREKGTLAPTDRLPRSHREALLVLSVIASFQGDASCALTAAEAGLKVGQELHAPFVEAVAYMRLGHAWQLHENNSASPSQAEAYYHQALRRCDELGVRRGRAEPLMGLTLWHGYRGDPVTAERYGREAQEILQGAGDAWLEAYVHLSLAVAAIHNHALTPARSELKTAISLFTRCGDPFGLAISCLWQGIVHYYLANWGDFRTDMETALRGAQVQGYDYIFLRPTLFGPRRREMLIPVLQEVARRRIRPDYVAWLLNKMGVDSFRPEEAAGPALRVQTLGYFRVWRQGQELTSRDWQREKARHLFALLITYRRQLLHKEQIIEHLWPESDPVTADRDFKVALNALNHALEPERVARTTPTYILRHQAAYGLNLAAPCWIDADEFESLIRQAETAADPLTTLRQALALYQGDYLEDARYENWASGERERLLTLYLRATERLARLLLQRQEYDEVIHLCHQILERDNCWEEAYRLQMRVYGSRGNSAQVQRVYEQCKKALATELNVSPSIETVALCHTLLSVAGL